jgi:hypothetical protein
MALGNTNQGFAGGGGSGGSGSVTTSPNSGIEVTGGTNVDTIYNSALDPTLATPEDVGGIPAGTTVADLTPLNLVQIVNDLLFPTVLPTYTIPTLGLTSSIGTAHEAGVTVSPVFNIDGIKNDAGAFDALSLFKAYNGGATTQIATTASPTITSATAIPPQFGFADPNNPNFNYNLNHTDTGMVIPAPTGTSASTVVYSNTSSYLAGLAKQNNKGATDARAAAVRSVNAPQSASTSLVSSNITFTGLYPYFYGAANAEVTFSDVATLIQAGSGTKVLASGAGALNMTFAAVGQWCWFAIFDQFATKTAWFESVLNQGTIGGATDLFSAPTTLPVNSPNGFWSAVNFKIYVAQKVTTLASAVIS